MATPNVTAPNIFYEFKDDHGVTRKTKAFQVVITAGEVKVTLHNPWFLEKRYVEGRGGDIVTAMREAGRKLHG